jgi:hypothetical protein
MLCLIAGVILREVVIIAQAVELVIHSNDGVPLTSHNMRNANFPAGDYDPRREPVTPVQLLDVPISSA